MGQDDEYECTAEFECTTLSRRLPPLRYLRERRPTHEKRERFADLFARASAGSMTAIGLPGQKINASAGTPSKHVSIRPGLHRGEMCRPVGRDASALARRPRRDVPKHVFDIAAAMWCIATARRESKSQKTTTEVGALK